MTNCSIIITTTDDLKVAKNIAEKLVDKNLAKCVWRDEINSTYEWEGKIVTDSEYRLFIKSTKAKYKDIEAIIKELHNYDLPGIIEIDITNGSKEFLSWIKETK